eukprot:3717407-Pyramimonas_sp.AAC.1
MTVPNSAVTDLQLELSQENHRHLEQHLYSTHSFAYLALVENRVQTSRCLRRTRLTILGPLGVPT